MNEISALVSITTDEKSVTSCVYDGVGSEVVHEYFSRQILISKTPNTTIRAGIEDNYGSTNAGVFLGA